MRYIILIASLACAGAVMAQDAAKTGLDIPEADAGLDLDMPDTDADAGVNTSPKKPEIVPKMKVGNGVSLGVGTMDPDSALPDGSAANIEPDDKFDLEDPAGGVTLKKSF